MPHPMQPVVLDERGTPRFKENKIVSYLLELCRTKGIFDLNMLAILPFDVEDRVQLMQLIGYSVSGAGDLSFMPEALITEADAAAEALK
jgi:hypothetical protein